MKKSNLLRLPVSAALFILSGCAVFRPSSETEKSIAFYNVENLFDTQDDPLTLDEEFTPAGRLQWTEERYESKLKNLAKVVESMGFPTLLGLAEVENAAVLNDLCENTSLSAPGYSFVHFDSPDRRGIDVALLFQADKFKVLKTEAIRIEFPADLKGDQPDYTTRDVLHVEGIFHKKDPLHVFVAHFPSRRGGQKESEPKRIFVAKQIRQRVDGIFTKNPKAQVIIMGDMNDEPTDPSVAETLDAQPLSETPLPATLYNPFFKLHMQGLGTYHYRGDWNMLDQIILSGSLLGQQGGLHFTTPAIFRRDWMLYNDPKFGPLPDRTYGGPRYFGGFSDHLPVLVNYER